MPTSSRLKDYLLKQKAIAAQCGQKRIRQREAVCKRRNQQAIDNRLNQRRDTDAVDIGCCCRCSDVANRFVGAARMRRIVHLYMERAQQMIRNRKPVHHRCAIGAKHEVGIMRGNGTNNPTFLLISIESVPYARVYEI